MALKTGLYIAKKQGLTNLEVETDSADVITCLDNGMIILNDIVHECRLLMRQVKVQAIQHIFREPNKPAHMMAKDALSGNIGGDLNIIYYAPNFVTAALTSDYEGPTYLVKYVNKDVCSRLVSFGNKNVLQDMLLDCNSQVGYALSGTLNVVNSAIM
ncbi:hypothetical protein A4A49_55213 [Nicotiana attenuata]|uniref:RNase H type-1 domain-containing protein n=1 Tax=Nicotiana attenuata TaxID=49451 RepID=A0A1J6IZV3_NICAT|nr:hypothetical protein A4A49_57611 [Nicotiana attenuata]OIT31553.1 hypothetical protein A4A49_55213 [Nicotiana attenuata]